MSPSNERWRLACFDLDGTLVHGTSTCLHLSRSLGHEAVLANLEEQYARGEISNAEVAEADARYYTGLSLARVEELLSDIPLIEGLAQTVETLGRRGIPSIICTVTWKFAAEILAKRYGFAAASGCEMSITDTGLLSGKVSKHFDEHSKLKFVQEYCAVRGIPMNCTFAVGDSRSDIPLFGAVGFSVALNATPLAKQAATCSLETAWLPDVLRLLPRYGT
jgi:phosphoserine phosphatase